ncbi:response regulator [Persicobacter psychrovividus]|uniref:Response regulatory domain-containing protein n=1 Tax=Persicobacter psychrovividus TaxID=387638 RepID=A0ABM7VIY1_9BACT|nr:hypothetical protein PEPS_31930 [Persicobacter psychrovividus]
MKIIIIDDEKEICLMLGKILAKLGHRVHCAHDCANAKILLKREQATLYFLDLNLPDGSGFDLISFIDHPANIYFMSAWDGESERKQVEALNVNGFIHKPFTKKDITLIIDQLPNE